MSRQGRAVARPVESRSVAWLGGIAEPASGPSLDGPSEGMVGIREGTDLVAISRSNLWYKMGDFKPPTFGHKKSSRICKLLHYNVLTHNMTLQETA